MSRRNGSKSINNVPAYFSPQIQVVNSSIYGNIDRIGYNYGYDNIHNKYPLIWKDRVRIPTFVKYYGHIPGYKSLKRKRIYRPTYSYHVWRPKKYWPIDYFYETEPKYTLGYSYVPQFEYSDFYNPIYPVKIKFY